MVKSTKTCELVVHLTTGDCVTGRFHIDASTSSTVRPSDAIRQDKSGYLLLTDVKITSDGEPVEKPVVLFPANAIAMIDVSSAKWAT